MAEPDRTNADAERVSDIVSPMQNNGDASAEIAASHPQRYPKHENKAKGQMWAGECNRTACKRLGATWWNMGTYGLYCPDCAYQINKANRSAPPLCVEVPAKPPLDDMEKFKRDHDYYGWHQ